MRRCVFGVVVLSFVLVAGCWGGGDDDPGFEVDVPGLQAGEDWDPQVLPQPPEGQEPTAQSAAEFAAYVLRLHEYASSTGDVDALDAVIIDPVNCRFCVELREQIEGDPASTLVYEEPIEVRAVDIDPDFTSPNYSLILTLLVPDTVRVDAETGEVIEMIADEDDKQARRVWVVWGQDQWQVRSYFRSRGDEHWRSAG